MVAFVDDIWARSMRVGIEIICGLGIDVVLRIVVFHEMGLTDLLDNYRSFFVCHRESPHVQLRAFICEFTDFDVRAGSLLFSSYRLGYLVRGRTGDSVCQWIGVLIYDWGDCICC